MKLRHPVAVSGAQPHSVRSRYVRKARDCTVCSLQLSNLEGWYGNLSSFPTPTTCCYGLKRQTFLFWTSRTTPSWQPWSNYSSDWEQIWWISHPQTHKRETLIAFTCTQSPLLTKRWYKAIPRVQFSNRYFGEPKYVFESMTNNAYYQQSSISS